MALYENEKVTQRITHRFDQLTVQDEKNALDAQVYDDSPPPYEARFASSSHPSPHPFATIQPPAASQTPRTLLLPCVLPQISKPFGSPFGSPFTRAYPPSLASREISQTDFLAFIDGLNEVFISHPLFQGASAAGSIMQMFHGTAVVQFVGMGVQATSDLSSAATSYLRTKAYLAACNVDLFHPRGLHAAVLSTKDMLTTIGYPEERLRIASLERVDGLERDAESTPGSQAAENKPKQSTMTVLHDPRARKMDALNGYVAPLDFDVPAVVPPENLLSKMSAWQAHRVASKSDEKEAKRHAKSRTRQGGEGELRAKDERKLDRKRAKLEKTLDKGDSKRQQRDIRKAQRGYEREEKKIERKIEKRAEKVGKDKGKSKVNDKEEQQANKIRWMVIAQWQGGEDEQASDSSSLSSA